MSSPIKQYKSFGKYRLKIETRLICAGCGFTLECYEGAIAPNAETAARYEEHAKFCEGKTASDWPQDFKSRALAKIRGEN